VLTLRVVKIGGNELDHPAWVSACARALATGGPTVIVHGGGRAVSELSRRLSLPVEKRDGMRVTTAPVAEAVEMVLSGPVNRLLVAALRAAGLDAIGLSGADGGLLTATQMGGGLGYVGEITRVRTALIESLLLAGLTPVIAPVTPDPAGGAVALNVNADSAAAVVAAALRATELLFVSDVPGVMVSGVPQPAIATGEIERLIADGVAADGMAAKLRAAERALAGGAQTVRIGDLRMLTDPAAGTRLVAAPASPAVPVFPAAPAVLSRSA
jgi:acetylglutamate kinase